MGGQVVAVQILGGYDQPDRTAPPMLRILDKMHENCPNVR